MSRVKAKCSLHHSPQCITRDVRNIGESAHDDQNEWSVGWSGCGWKCARVGVVNVRSEVGRDGYVMKLFIW